MEIASCLSANIVANIFAVATFPFIFTDTHTSFLIIENGAEFRVIMKFAGLVVRGAKIISEQLPILKVRGVPGGSQQCQEAMLADPSRISFLARGDDVVLSPPQICAKISQKSTPSMFYRW